MSMDEQTANIAQMVMVAAVNNDMHQLLHLAMALGAAALLAVPGQAFIEHTIGSWAKAPKWAKAISPAMLSALGTFLCTKLNISPEQALTGFASCTAFMHIVNASPIAADSGVKTVTAPAPAAADPVNQ